MLDGIMGTLDQQVDDKKSMMRANPGMQGTVGKDLIVFIFFNSGIQLFWEAVFKRNAFSNGITIAKSQIVYGFLVV